jgi:hypothetical protein
MKELRWLLFVPAGLFEILLAACAGSLATIHYVCSTILDIAYRLPSMDWYFGGEYKRKRHPAGYPDFHRKDS